MSTGNTVRIAVTGTGVVGPLGEGGPKPFGPACFAVKNHGVTRVFIDRSE